MSQDGSPDFITWPQALRPRRGVPVKSSWNKTWPGARSPQPN